MKMKKSDFAGLLTAFLLLLGVCSAVSAQGFDERYEAYVLTNGDILVRQNPEIILLHGDVVTPIVLPPPVEEFLLQSQGSSYSVNTDASGIDIEAATLVEIVLGDFNIDGLNDLLIKNLSSAVSGAYDQIVFADSSGLPNIVTPIDEEFQSFFEELYQWILNPNYFEENATPVYETRYRLWGIYQATNPLANIFEASRFIAEGLASCEVVHDYCTNVSYIANDWIPEYTGTSCAEEITRLFTTGTSSHSSLQEQVGTFCHPYTYSHFIIYSEQYEVDKDYSGFNQDALIFADALDPFLLYGDIDTDSTDSVIIEEILFNYLKSSLSLSVTNNDVCELGIPTHIPGCLLKELLTLLFLMSVEVATENIEKPLPIFHYTTQTGANAILGGQNIVSSSGTVFFTNQVYASSDVVMDRLSLCGDPRIGYFVLDGNQVPGLSGFTEVSPITCPDGAYRNGKGTEATAPSPVDPQKRRFIPFIETNGP